MFWQILCWCCWGPQEETSTTLCYQQWGWGYAKAFRWLRSNLGWLERIKLWCYRFKACWSFGCSDRFVSWASTSQLGSRISSMIMQATEIQEPALSRNPMQLGYQLGYCLIKSFAGTCSWDLSILQHTSFPVCFVLQQPPTSPPRSNVLFSTRSQNKSNAVQRKWSEDATRTPTINHAVPTMKEPRS